ASSFSSDPDGDPVLLAAAELVGLRELVTNFLSKKSVEASATPATMVATSHGRRFGCSRPVAVRTRVPGPVVSEGCRTCCNWEKVGLDAPEVVWRRPEVSSDAGTG